MANGGDPVPMSTMPRVAAATESVEEQNPAGPPPPHEIPTSNPPPPGFTANRPPRPPAPGRANRTQENQSLIDSFRSAALTGPATEACLQSLFSLRTKSEEEGATKFRELISALNGNDRQSMATLLTFKYDRYFLMIARNRNGSNRLQMLLEEFNDVHTFFFAAILRHFFHIMTEKNASYVAIQGLRVFSEEKRREMYDRIRCHAIRLARDQYGTNALRIIITNMGHSFYRDQLLHIVTLNALTLSCDANGTFVVQHVLKLQDLDNSLYRDQLLYALTLSCDANGTFVVRHVLKLNDWCCTHNVAVSLNGRCVELSFNKYGSYIVEKLLETEWWVMVVTELLGCDEVMLRCLAGSEYGNFVVLKALRVTQGEVETSAALFWGLVNKLMPSLSLLEDSHGRRVARFLEVIQYFVNN